METQPPREVDGAMTSGKIWLDRAMILWIVLAAAVSVKTIVQPARHTVYPVFAVGAQHWWADAPLYVHYEGLDLFRYSPTFAVSMTPFGLLPHALGGILWNLLGIGLLLWSTRLLVREVLPGPWPAWREALFLGLMFVGAARGIWSGQNNALLLSLALFGIVAVRRQRWWSAAFLLTLAAFIKIWPLALIMLLAAIWPRQLIPRVGVASLVVALAPFLTRPFSVVCSQYAGWYTMLSATRNVRWPGYRDIWTIGESLGLSLSPTLFLGLQLTMALAVLGWCLWQRRRTRDDGALLTSILSMWVAWQMLFGPGTERLAYLLIAPLTSWAVLASWQERRWRTLSIAAWLTTSILGTGGIERSLSSLSLAPAILPSGVVIFVVWLILRETAWGMARNGGADRTTGKDTHQWHWQSAGRQSDCPSHNCKNSSSAAV